MLEVSSIKIDSKKLALKNPYRLSFVTLSEFETLIVTISLDNGIDLLGEVVPLPGYGSESFANVNESAMRFSEDIQGMTLDKARSYLKTCITTAPFASSLFLSAIDSLYFMPKAKSLGFNLPIIAAVSSADDLLLDKVRSLAESGYEWVKVKLTGDLNTDLTGMDVLKKCLPIPLKFRFDANQGYSLEDSRVLLEWLSKNLSVNTELLEQPLHADYWEEMEELCRNFSIPLMLDESIQELCDVESASRIGCRFIKLKLCKQGGLQEVIEFAREGTKRGLRVVFGNGVSTDIANFMELSLFHKNKDLFWGASESIGFEKLVEPILYKDLKSRNGRASFLE